MLFDELKTLNDIISIGRSTARFRDEHDPDVDRLYNSSPQMTDFDFGMTYEQESVFRVNDSREEKTEKADDKKQPDINPLNALKYPGAGLGTSVPLFQRVEVASRPTAATKSFLSSLLTSQKSSSEGKKGDANLIELTIYLPDFSGITVKVNESDNFDKVIKKILKTHKDERRRPPLHYHVPDFYELRLHEGI